MAEPYLIWSNEHKRWWGPDHAGYEPRVENAGHYSRKEALEICTNAIPGSTTLGMLPEIPVRVRDISIILKSFRDTYPGHDPEPTR